MGRALAQLNGQNIKGDVGLKSGSQAPPGVYFAVPLWFYTADTVKDKNGDEFLTGNLDAALFGAALNVVTPRKLLGANYGFLVVLPWASNRIQGIEDFDSNPGAGLTDMFIQPISLGWHTPRADATLAYGVYVPTGRYENGATAATFNFQSEKKDSTTRVGNIMNLEGGVGADFLGGGLSAGLAYYGTFKLTEDRFDNPLIGALIQGKNRVWGLGPEFTLAIAANRTVYGFVTVRYQWEMAARTTTEGAAWNIMATFPLKPIRLP